MIIRIFEAGNDNLNHGNVECRLGQIDGHNLLDPRSVEPLQEKGEVVCEGFTLRR